MLDEEEEGEEEEEDEEEEGKPNCSIVSSSGYGCCGLAVW